MLAGRPTPRQHDVLRQAHVLAHVSSLPQQHWLREHALLDCEIGMHQRRVDLAVVKQPVEKPVLVSRPQEQRLPERTQLPFDPRRQFGRVQCRAVHRAA